MNINSPKYRLSPKIWLHIKELGINRQKPTKRGKQGGTKKHLPVKETLHNLSSSSVTTSGYCNFALWNARSMKPKTHMICDIIERDIDVMAITESWLSGDNRDDPVLADMRNTLPDYKLFHAARINRRGGGICLFLRKAFNVQIHETNNFESFEYMDVTFKSPSSLPVRIVTILSTSDDR